MTSTDEIHVHLASYYMLYEHLAINSLISALVLEEKVALPTCYWSVLSMKEASVNTITCVSNE